MTPPPHDRRAVALSTLGAARSPARAWPRRARCGWLSPLLVSALSLHCAGQDSTELSPPAAEQGGGTLGVPDVATGEGSADAPGVSGPGQTGSGELPPSDGAAVSATDVEPSAPGDPDPAAGPTKRPDPSDDAPPVDGSRPDPDLVEDPSEPAPDEEPPPPEPWRSGLDGRPPAAALSLPASLSLAPQGWVVVEAYPALTFDDPLSFIQAPGSDQIVVTEREGRIFAFRNDPDVTTKTLILDLSDRNQGELDSGLQSLVFHPEFGRDDSPNGGYVYVHYAYTPNPIVGVRPPDQTPTTSRLSRFTMDPTTLLIDPASELVLIDQDDEIIWHQGGAMYFGPHDGFLYLTVGDEGGYQCFVDNCQRIDKDLFSGVLRIDVDMRGGDISHPIVRQPQNGRTASYYIPNDNPFVGRPGVLEEFYAVGLRSPHKMTYDAVDDITWIGEVGEIQHEELNVLSPGANYQWNVLEGDVAANAPMPAEPLGVWTDPVFVLDRQEAASVIGGYVYRGSRHPNLYGKYIFGDFVSGSIWALSYSYDGVQATALSRELLVSSAFRGRADGLTSFGVDRDDELYILTLGAEAKIYKLERTEGFSNAPLRLSETGAFADTASPELVPNAGLVPYDVIAPLWSDGAVKRRWVSVPDGRHAVFSETGPWSFPEGTVLVKQFDLALDEARPDQVRRLETRFLVHGQGGQYYGLTYKWNDAGTDAELLLESQTEVMDVTLASGEHRGLKYFYPGPNDCAVCHNPEAGSVLGPRTLQLNHAMRYPGTGREANQLFTWSQAGILDAGLDEAQVRALGSFVAIDDDSRPLEQRVRSYWASNCSMCHGSVSDIRATWDARFDVPLSEQGVLYGPSQSSDALLIVPGEPDASFLFRRSATTSPGLGMPPLGRSVPDPDYVAALEAWIGALEP